MKNRSSIAKAVANVRALAKSVLMQNHALQGDLQKSLRFAHPKPGEPPKDHHVAKTSHGTYRVSKKPGADGNHTMTYTPKRKKGEPKPASQTYTAGSHREALGYAVEHHLSNRPAKVRKKKDPNAPKKVKAPAAGGDCPPCP